jgi:hypothetical protein
VRYAPGEQQELLPAALRTLPRRSGIGGLLLTVLARLLHQPPSQGARKARHHLASPAALGVARRLAAAQAKFDAAASDEAL